MDASRQLHAAAALPQYRSLLRHVSIVTEQQQGRADICLVSLFALCYSCVFPMLAFPWFVRVLCVRAADGVTSH